MTTQRDKLCEDVRLRILRLPQNNPEMSLREFAQAVSGSTEGSHSVHKALVGKGMLKLSNFTAARDKPRYVLVLGPKGIAAKTDLARRFMIRSLLHPFAAPAPGQWLRDQFMLNAIRISACRIMP